MQQINKGIKHLKSMISHLDRTDAYGTLHSTAAYTVLLRAHEIFSRRDYILGHKTSLNKFKRIQIIQGMFSDYNGMKLDINNKDI